MTKRMHMIEALSLLLTISFGVAPVAGQTIGSWYEYDDMLTGGTCDLIHAADLELVVVYDSGQLAIVTGEDMVLTNTSVDSETLDVTIDGTPAGYLDFDDDANGNATIFWFAGPNNVTRYNATTSDAVASNRAPNTFSDTLCNACTLIDDPDACDAGGGMSDGDGSDGGTGGDSGDDGGGMGSDDGSGGGDDGAVDDGSNDMPDNGNGSDGSVDNSNSNGNGNDNGSSSGSDGGAAGDDGGDDGAGGAASNGNENSNANGSSGNNNGGSSSRGGFGCGAGSLGAMVLLLLGLQLTGLVYRRRR